MPHEFTEGLKETTDHSLLISAAACVGTYLNGSLDFTTPHDDIKLKLYSEASYAAAVVGQGAFATARTYGERWRQALGNAGTTFVIGAAALAEVAYDRNESPGLDDYIPLGGASGVAFVTSMLLSLKHHLAARQRLKEEVFYTASREAAQEKGKAVELSRRSVERPITASNAEDLRALLDAMEYTYAMDLVRMRTEEFPDIVKIAFNAAKYENWASRLGVFTDFPYDLEVFDDVGERHAPWIDLLMTPASNVSSEELKKLQSAYTSLYPGRKLPTKWREPIRCGVTLNGKIHYPRADRVAAFREAWYQLQQEVCNSGDMAKPPYTTPDDVLDYLVYDQVRFFSHDDERPSKPRDTASLQRVRGHYRKIEAAQILQY